MDVNLMDGSTDVRVRIIAAAGASYPDDKIIQAIDHAHAVGISAVQVMVMLGGEYDLATGHDILDQLAARFLPTATPPPP